MSLKHCYYRLACPATAAGYALLLALVFLFGACVTDDIPDSSVAVKCGDRLPDFEVMLSDGSTITTASLAGRPSVIVFFNTSCEDCRRDLPVIDCVSRDFGDSVYFLAIARDESIASIASFWADNAMTVPCSPQSDKYLYSLFAKSGIPQVFVSDGSLIVRAVFGPDDSLSAGRLSEILDSLLDGHTENQ